MERSGGVCRAGGLITPLLRTAVWPHRQWAALARHGGAHRANCGQGVSTKCCNFACTRAAVELEVVCRFETQDGLYDLAFSEVHEHQVATASGDGSVKLWDMKLNVSALWVGLSDQPGA